MLFAASIGQIAVNDNRRQTGLFSGVIRDLLERWPKGEWPPDAESLQEQVANAFQKLREKGRTAQVPTHVWFESPEEEGRLLFAARPLDPGVTAEAGGCQLLSTAEAAELRATLDGMVMPESLGWLYNEAIRNVQGLPPYVDDLWLSLRALRTAVNPRPLFEFVVRLANQSDAVTHDSLWSWLQRTVPRWSNDLDELKTLKSELARKTVLVRVQPGMLGPGFDVTVWSYSRGGGRQDACTTEPWTWQQMGDRLSALLHEIITTGEVLPLIEFQLPIDILQLPVEAIPIRLGAEARGIGELCPVVVRPLGCPVEVDAIRAWHRKWQDLLEHGDRHREGAVRVMPVEAVSALRAALWQDVVCLGLTGLHGHTESEVRAALNTAFAVGIPVVLWHRATPTRQDDGSATASVLRGRPVNTLPDVVFQLRRNARHPQARIDHPGRDIVLLWHDPGRVPSGIRWRPPP